MTRQEINREIIKQISEFNEEHPDLRFDQILWILGIENGQDNFYRESQATLDDVLRKREIPISGV